MPTEPSKTSRGRSAADKIDAQQIGQGSLYTEGGWGGKSGDRGWGLKGQLGKYQRSGRRSGETRNLSKQNLEDMERLISDRLKNHHRGYGATLNRKDKKAIMKEAENLVRTQGSKFTRQDKKDLKKIVETLQGKNKNVAKADDSEIIIEKQEGSAAKPRPINHQTIASRAPTPRAEQNQPKQKIQATVRRADSPRGLPENTESEEGRSNGSTDSSKVKDLPID